MFLSTNVNDMYNVLTKIVKKCFDTSNESDDENVKKNVYIRIIQHNDHNCRYHLGDSKQFLL